MINLEISILLGMNNKSIHLFELSIRVDQHGLKPFEVFNKIKLHKLIIMQTHVSRKIYRIVVLPLFSDNYSYVVEGTDTSKLVLIDPADPTKIGPFLNKQYPHHIVSHILYTHKHWDHAGQAQELLQLLTQNGHKDLKIFIGQADQKQVSTANQFIQQTSSFTINKASVTAYHVPCHTKGHLVYHFKPQNLTEILPLSLDGYSQFQAEECAFTGDTLFCGGVGKFFQGNAQQMTINLRILLKNINEECSIFNGHEYTYKNLQWAVKMEPQNIQIQQMLNELKIQQQSVICTLPTNMKRQKNINLFVRAITGTSLHKSITENSVELMNILRNMKNQNLGLQDYKSHL